MRKSLAQWGHRIVPRRIVNFFWNLGSDLKDLPVRLSSPRPMPWRLWHNVGGGDFHALGAHYFAQFSEAVALEQTDHVLDMGCGAGRVAFPIAAFLQSGGRYTGFDLSQRALDFAQRHVASRAALTFVHAPVQSREYAGVGAPASQYRFPVDDGSVDAALAISLFSHLLPQDAARYLAETGRALRPGGRVFLTAFIVDEPARQTLQDRRAACQMTPISAEAWAADPRHPERAIAFEKTAFEDWMRQAGLVWARPMRTGYWATPEKAGEFQDQIVLEKPAIDPS